MTDALDKFKSLVDESSDRNLNEADTRHKIIDVLIHDVFAWPRNRVDCEEFIKPGFADYVLKNPRKEAMLFIEAKKAGFYFSLPNAAKADETNCFVKIKTLLTDDNIREAMVQVRTYCIETRMRICCGYQWP